ncbi:MAG: hypothetical protein ACU0CT_03610 [Paracoccaceae bacterium]
MSEDLNPAEAAGTEEVVSEEVEEAEQETDQTEQVEESEGDDDKPKRETAKERRERDKAYKQRLREEAEQHKKSADEAEARRARILDAGKQISAPVEKDFDDYTEFVAAKAVWRHAQQATERDANEAFTEAEAARQRAEAIRQQEAQYTDNAWRDQIKDAQARYTDFEAVAFDQSVPITDQMAEIIKSSDMGADLAYYLGKNKAIAADIAKMQPIEAARVMGRIEASLSAPRPRTETKAPDPITPVRGKAAASKDPAKMSYAEYKAARAAGTIR